MGGAQVVDQVSTRRPHLYKDVDQSRIHELWFCQCSVHSAVLDRVDLKVAVVSLVKEACCLSSLLYSPFWEFFKMGLMSVLHGVGGFLPVRFPPCLPSSFIFARFYTRRHTRSPSFVSLA